MNSNWNSSWYQVQLRQNPRRPANNRDAQPNLWGRSRPNDRRKTKASRRGEMASATVALVKVTDGRIIDIDSVVTPTRTTIQPSDGQNRRRGRRGQLTPTSPPKVYPAYI